MDKRVCNIGWGELPEKAIDLNVPFFMTADYKRTERRIREAEEARVAAAVGKERRKLREQERKKKAFKKGFFAITAVIAFLIIAEKLCMVLP